MASTPGTVSSTPQQFENQNHRFALGALTTLFFMWGFITCLNDILIPHLKNVFDLNYTQAMLIQSCFFGAYFIMSLPAGNLVHRIGYQKGIVVGLVIAGIGCLMFLPAASLGIYALFLGALFVLASGITILQVSANPYVTILGPSATASSRLTMTQAFNSLGTTIAPFFGAFLILSVAAGTDVASKQAEAEAVQLPYMILAISLLVLAGIFAFLKLPTFKDEESQNEGFKALLQYPQLVLGAVGIFVYVGAEVSIGSLLVNFLGEPDIAGLAESDAAKYVAYYWGGAMVGRFIGSVVMRTIHPGRVLAFNAAMAVVLIVLAVSSGGSLAMIAILAVGLCNSIMFPTIFSLALEGLGSKTSQGSGLLCLAIVGGALLPILQGAMADTIGLHLSFIMPAVCYLFIMYFGARAAKASA